MIDNSVLLLFVRCCLSVLYYLPPWWIVVWCLLGVVVSISSKSTIPTELFVNKAFLGVVSLKRFKAEDNISYFLSLRTDLKSDTLSD